MDRSVPTGSVPVRQTENMADDLDFKLPRNVDDWGNLDGGQLSDEEAGKILRERLGFKGSIDSLTNNQLGWNTNVWKRLTDVLVEMLPPELRTEAVLRQLDMRTLLAPIMNTEWGAEQGGTRTFNGMELDPSLQRLAAAAFLDFRERLRVSVEEQLQAVGTPDDQLAVQTRTLLEQWRDVPPGTLSRTWEFAGQMNLDPATGAVTTTGGSPDLNNIATLITDVMNGGTGDVNASFLTPDDLRIQLQHRSPQDTIGSYYRDQSERAAAAAAGITVPDDSARIAFSATAPNGMPGDLVGTEHRDRRLSWGEALHLPLTWTRAETAAWTDRMTKAGIFNQVPGGPPTVKGDPADPQFKAGYQLMLAKSFERGIPISRMLDEDALAYEEAMQNNVRARLADPASIRAAANIIGRSELGRDLTATEIATWTKKIHELQKEQVVAEADETGGDVVDVDWEARIRAEIEGSPEGQAHSVADQFTTFQNLLAGPGRGQV